MTCSRVNKQKATDSTTNISEECGACFWETSDFLPVVLRLRGESEDTGLAGISISSCNASAFEPVCVSNTARAARSLLIADCRECATGTDFNEDTGDDGFEDADESGDLGSCVDFLVDGCAAFGFFDCQQQHIQLLVHRNIYKSFKMLLKPETKTNNDIN